MRSGNRPLTSGAPRVSGKTLKVSILGRRFPTPVGVSTNTASDDNHSNRRADSRSHNSAVDSHSHNRAVDSHSRNSVVDSHSSHGDSNRRFQWVHGSSSA